MCACVYVCKRGEGGCNICLQTKIWIWRNSDNFPQCVHQIRREKSNPALKICIMKEDQITLSAFKDLDGAQCGDISTNLSLCHISSFPPLWLYPSALCKSARNPPPTNSLNTPPKKSPNPKWFQIQLIYFPLKEETGGDKRTTPPLWGDSAFTSLIHSSSRRRDHDVNWSHGSGWKWRRRDSAITMALWECFAPPSATTTPW